MSSRSLTRALGALRLASGLGFAVAPGPLGSALVGADAASPGTRLFAAAFGARDAVLGAALWRSAGRRGARSALAACAVVDAADAVLVLRGYRGLPPGRRELALAISVAPAVAAAVVALADRRGA